MPAQTNRAAPAGLPDNWLSNAYAQIGRPYVFGGGVRSTDDPANGFDCSSFTGYVLGLPTNLWTAQAQYDATRRVNADQLQPGDLVFFRGTYDAGPGVVATHVGIYLGDGHMISAIGSGVGVQDLSEPYWQQHYLGAGRVGEAASR